jgi:hypothetical protein
MLPQMRLEVSATGFLPRSEVKDWEGSCQSISAEQAVRRGTHRPCLKRHEARPPMPTGRTISETGGKRGRCQGDRSRHHVLLAPDQTP